ncbi:MAG: hypothetical protein ABI969_13875 [bacterium]
MAPRVLPADDFVAVGTRDLELGIESDMGLLMSIGAPRLSRLGLKLAAPLSDPEHRLYERLAEIDGKSAHSRYNALISPVGRLRTSCRTGAHGGDEKTSVILFSYNAEPPLESLRAASDSQPNN